MKRYTFHMKGMHCKGCVALTESEIESLKEVQRARSSLAAHSVEIVGDFGDQKEEEIIENINKVLEPRGYSLSIEKTKHLSKWSDFIFALPIAAVCIALFILLQKLGVVNLVTASEVSYSTAFIIGLIASVSTCMAVVGGLVLSMSANFAKEGDQVRPQVLFHIGRLVSFFILGGVIGALGSAFQLGSISTFVLGFIVAVVLLILGINLLDVFSWSKRLQFTLPSFIGRRVHNLKNINHNLTPLLVGLATFFLPCGFTQSMQLYALATGSFWTGASIMLAFALGTFPMLAILSFSSLGIHTKAQAGIFYKTIGLIVIFFAIINLANSFASLGLINPLFTF